MNGARYAYLERICDLVAQGEDIVIVSNDYAAPILDKFRVEYPDRYVSVGIAEQNLISVSCGLALEGKRVIAYGCAPFPILRAFDQIKNAAAMMNIPINIAVAGTGFAIPEWGATHYNVEDISLLRTIPNMQIITPTDNILGTTAAEYALINSLPTYIRFDKYAEGEVYGGKTINFERGFEELRCGSDVVIVTCGSFTLKILQLADEWHKKGISVGVIDMYSLPIDVHGFMSTIGDNPLLIIEEHILAGGIGSMALEILRSHGKTNVVRRMGIDFDLGYPQTSGSREYYLDLYGLSNQAITNKVVELSRNKV